MSNQSLSLYGSTVPFANTPEYYIGLAQNVGLILDSQEGETLQQIYDTYAANNDVSWCDFYTNGFVPAYNENLRNALIRRGQSREGCQNPLDQLSCETDFDALKLSGAEDLARQIFGDYIDDYKSKNQGRYSLYQANSILMGGVGTVAAAFNMNDIILNGQSSGIASQFLSSTLGLASLCGLSLAAFTGYKSYQIQQGYEANEELKVQIDNFIESIAQGQPLRFDGYDID